MRPRGHVEPTRNSARRAPRPEPPGPHAAVTAATLTTLATLALLGCAAAPAVTQLELRSAHAGPHGAVEDRYLLTRDDACFERHFYDRMEGRRYLIRECAFPEATRAAFAALAAGFSTNESEAGHSSAPRPVALNVRRDDGSWRSSSSAELLEQTRALHRRLGSWRAEAERSAWANAGRRDPGAWSFVALERTREGAGSIYDQRSLRADGRWRCVSISLSGQVEGVVFTAQGRLDPRRAALALDELAAAHPSSAAGSGEWELVYRVADDRERRSRHGDALISTWETLVPALDDDCSIRARPGATEAAARWRR